MGKSGTYKFQVGRYVYYKGIQYLVVQSGGEKAILECYDFRYPLKCGERITVKQIVRY